MSFLNKAKALNSFDYQPISMSKSGHNPTSDLKQERTASALFSVLIPLLVVLLFLTVNSSCGGGEKIPLTYEDSLKVKKEMMEVREDELQRARDQVESIKNFEQEAEVRYEDIKKRKEELEQMLNDYDSGQ
jgi:hypothetical protein